MLTLATVGLAGYGLFAVSAGLGDLILTHRLEVLANLAAIVLGAVLLIAAALVRTRVPGGLAFAVGALLGLQALALHDANHLYGFIAPLPQFARAAFAALLVALAWGASKDAERS
jgi:hypothetical protein